MANVNKKQASLAVLAVVFATALFVSVIATSDNAFARHHKHNNHKSISQSISQSNDINQNSQVVTAGAGSPVIASGNNIGACANVNLGGNAAAQ